MPGPFFDCISSANAPLLLTMKFRGPESEVTEDRRAVPWRSSWRRPGRAQHMRLAIGPDEDTCWWLTGQEVLRAPAMSQRPTDDDVSKPLALNRSADYPAFRCGPRRRSIGLLHPLCDARRKPITNISIALNPPAAARLPEAIRGCLLRRFSATRKMPEPRTSPHRNSQLLEQKL